MKHYESLGCNFLADPSSVSYPDQIRMMKDVGFGAFFSGWDRERLPEIAEAAAKLGMTWQSIHAPFAGRDRLSFLWREGENGDRITAALIECLRDTARFGIPVTVIHPYIAYNDVPPNELGLERFSRIVNEAERLGVTVGFENVDDGTYLKSVMEHFWSSPACGFCFDSGHELCYEDGKDMMALYGEKLCHTHLHDNLGNPVGRDPILRDFDDLHLPPGDGIVDWAGVMDRIDASPYAGPLVCELKRITDPNHAEYRPAYGTMPLEDFYALAHRRLAEVASRTLKKNHGDA